MGKSSMTTANCWAQWESHRDRMKHWSNLAKTRIWSFDIALMVELGEANDSGYCNQLKLQTGLFPRCAIGMTCKTVDISRETETQFPEEFQIIHFHRIFHYCIHKPSIWGISHFRNPPNGVSIDVRIRNRFYQISGCFEGPRCSLLMPGKERGQDDRKSSSGCHQFREI